MLDFATAKPTLAIALKTMRVAQQQQLDQEQKKQQVRQQEEEHPLWPAKLLCTPFACWQHVIASEGGSLEK